ncbi:MAG TPA: UDP-N-acetylglucosamine--N-acetylmuramyl-(pentapeptide) pyrophosphoryl-undecaprenol N-acetylglucosamine transferase [Candidatus Paceibacterota bacterium]
MIRIALTGGGTGGHMYPLIAVAEEIRSFARQTGTPVEMVYFGEAVSYEQLITETGATFQRIVSSKWRRYFSLWNLLEIPKFFIGCAQALWKLYWHMPDVMFSKGGPGTVPIILVSRFYMIPIVVHESDSIPGRANRIAGRFAKKVFVGFASAMDFFPKQRVEISGNPVRAELVAHADYSDNLENHAAAKRSFGFNDQEPLVCVFGGSQGAQSLNNFVMENARELVRHFQILHQVGDGNLENYKKEYEFTSKDWSEIDKKRYHYQGYFVDDLAEAYRAADVVLARAGASTLYECALFGKPAILIPLPSAANGHQKENAHNYAKSGAAIVVEEENFRAHLIIEQVQKIVQNPELMRTMGENARGFYKANAARVIAEGVLRTAV